MKVCSIKATALCAKKGGCPHPHAHTRTLRARSTREHASLTSRTYVWRAYPWRCAMCRYVYAWRAQQCAAQCSANTRTFTSPTHTQHCHFTSTTTFHQPPPERARFVARRRLYSQRGSDRSAGWDRLRSNPLVRKRRGCPHPHAHTRTPRARSTREHVSLTSRTCVWRAYPGRCAMCRYVYAWRAQQCTAQCSANTRTYTTLTHTQHCHFTSRSPTPSCCAYVTGGVPLAGVRCATALSPRFPCAAFGHCLPRPVAIWQEPGFR